GQRGAPAPPSPGSRQGPRHRGASASRRIALEQGHLGAARRRHGRQDACRRVLAAAEEDVQGQQDRAGGGGWKAARGKREAGEEAKTNLFNVPKHGTTITREILGRSDAARVLLRPASEGTGVIAGGGVRAVLELAGIRDILAKSLGTTNPINMAKATVNGLR